MPSGQSFHPIQSVVVCLYVAYLTDQPSQCYSGRCTRMLRKPGQAFSFYVYHAALSRGVWICISNGPYDRISAVCGETGYADPQAFEHLQILDDLIFILTRGKAVVERRFTVIVAIYDQAVIPVEPGPVNQQVDAFTTLYDPLGSLVKILVEPSAELAFAISAILRYVYDCLFSENPFAEPDETINLANIFPVLNKA